MKHLLLVFAALVVSLIAPQVRAQFEAVEPDHVEINVVDWDLRTVKYDDVFPDVDNISKGGTQSWLRLMIEYTVVLDPARAGRYSDPKNLWLDDLEIEWTVIIAPEKRGNQYDDRKAIRLNKVINYANINVNKRRYFAVAYVEPTLLSRYASKLALDDIFTRVSFRVGRKTRGEMGARGKKFAIKSGDIGRLSAAGRRGELFASEEVIRPIGGLLSRKETPWEWASYETFETIVEPKN